MNNLPKGYSCGQCGNFSRFSGWLYAHWNESVVHTCECGARTDLIQGKPQALHPPRAFHLAVGLWLDNYGEMYGVKRNPVEPDQQYRDRMLKELSLSHNYPKKGSHD